MNSSGWPDPVLSTCSLTPSPAVIVGMDGLPERGLAGPPGTAASPGAGRLAGGAAVIGGMDGLPERGLAGQPGTAASRGAGRRASGEWSVVGDVLDAHDVLVRARRGRRRVPGRPCALHEQL